MVVFLERLVKVIGFFILVVDLFMIKLVWGGMVIILIVFEIELVFFFLVVVKEIVKVLIVVKVWDGDFLVDLFLFLKF